MRVNRVLRVGACGLWVLGSGCTTLREIPRGAYAARSQRDHVRIVTGDGLLYEFDYANFTGDSLVGFRRRELETRVEEFVTLGFSHEQIATIWVRGIDWTRTGLVGAGVLVAVVLVALVKNPSGPTGSGSAGGGGRPPPG